MLAETPMTQHSPCYSAVPASLMNLLSIMPHPYFPETFYRIVKTSRFIQLVNPHAQRERGKVIDRGVHIYIFLWSKKYLNRTLEIDSPFQTLTVGLLVEFID